MNESLNSRTLAVVAFVLEKRGIEFEEPALASPLAFWDILVAVGRSLLANGYGLDILPHQHSTLLQRTSSFIYYDRESFCICRYSKSQEFFTYLTLVPSEFLIKKCLIELILMLQSFINREEKRY